MWNFSKAISSAPLFTQDITLSHSPVFVSNDDIHHAMKSTLQMKHTCTNIISLLLRTLNILVIMLFFDIPQLGFWSVFVFAVGSVIFVRAIHLQNRRDTDGRGGGKLAGFGQTRDDVLFISSERSLEWQRRACARERQSKVSSRTRSGCCIIKTTGENLCPAARTMLSIIS